VEDTSGRGVRTSVEAKKILGNPGLWKNNLAYIGNVLAAVSGMRSGEIRALRGQDIKADHIHVKHSFDSTYGLKGTKTGEERYIPLPKPVMDLLHSLKHGDEDFLFTVTVKKPVGDKFFIDGLYDALDKIGIDDAERRKRKISMHSWRHFLNSQLLAHGISEVKTRSITGHATAEMTAHYTHFTVEDYKDILEITTGIW
ncbi:MAG: tyrosine-type recombinase/integrase, partial [Synergistales bacterium]|nr:tyrosine-type recombinase/integrase [Synergistales bacterium]